MPISLNTFNQLHAEQQDPFPVRVLAFVNQATEAHTAEEIAAQLLGKTGKYAAALSTEVQAALPTVIEILRELVSQKRIRTAVQQTPSGPQALYCKLGQS